MAGASTNQVPTGGEGRELTGQEAPPCNLPGQLTTFLGRERDVRAIQSLLQTARLLTLTGTGGSGKTRLALAVARQLLPRYDDGVTFVDLAPLDDPDRVKDRIAQALGVEEQSAEPLWTSLQRFLARRQHLLLLDNFEHLLPAGPPLADLLGAAPHLTILVTSREPLHLYGEQAYLVAPLALPQEEDLTPEALFRSPAVRLFVERARAVRPNFQLNAQNAPVVAAICRLLDGLPLAIELAAARSRVFRPRSLLAHLQGEVNRQRSAPALSLLSGGARNLPDRQQTLRAAIDWSYHLLMASEQALFRRLAIFAGGCTLEAVETVCVAGEVDQDDAIDILTSLVEKNLLHAQEGPAGETRFTMLHVVREYAQERLRKQGEAGVVGERHARYFLGLAEEAATEVPGPKAPEWFDRLETEHDNVRIALRWALDHRRTEIALRGLPVLSVFWQFRGYAGEGRDWLEKVLAVSDKAPARLRAVVLEALAPLCFHRDDEHKALQYGERALTLYREIEDREGIARNLIGLGAFHRFLKQRDKAWVRLEEALRIGRELDDKNVISNALLELGAIALFRRDYERAQSLLQEALSLARALEAPTLIAFPLSLLGVIETEQGDHEHALGRLERALEILRGQKYPRLEASTIWHIGTAALRAGDLVRAASCFVQALETFVDLGLWGIDLANCIDGLAGVAVARRQDERAVRLWAGADLFRADYEISPIQRVERERAMTLVRTRITPADFERAWAAGRRLAQENRDDFIAFVVASRAAEPAPPDRPTFKLTPRQLEVLRLVARGLTDAEVAAELVISPRTVNNHLTTIYQKLDVNSRTAAARMALERGLV